MDDPSELELVATDELIDELMRRFDNTVICLSNDHDSERIGVLVRRNGEYLAEIGLLEFAKMCILEDFVDDMRKPLEDDE